MLYLREESGWFTEVVAFSDEDSLVLGLSPAMNRINREIFNVIFNKAYAWD
jgi:hypothetical protein